MPIDEDTLLYHKLKDAFTEVNLNRISRNLIRLYSEKQFDQLKQIVGLISDWVAIEICEDKRGFSKLIMLYHPDRIQYYHNELENYLVSNNPVCLQRLEHILVIQDIEEIALVPDYFEDIDYCPEYEWDNDTSGFSYFTDFSPPRNHKHRKTKVSKNNYTFYDAVRIRNYGNTVTMIPPLYFEDWEEVEMTECDINDLDGIEYCTNAVILDLSINSITDISPLFSLASVSELNLSGNKIGYIDALSNLLKLKSVDLSNNRIDDISPLFDLPELEFCDICGNRVPVAQIRELEELGVSVSHD